MKVVNFNERSCDKYRRSFDAYLDNELLVETNQDVLQHLNSCTECARILEDRARTKQLVRNAVTKEQAPPELVTALRSRLRSERPSFFAFNTARWTLAVAAVLLLAIVGVGSLQWARTGQLGDNDGVFPALTARMQELLRVGLNDHIHCAVLLQRWKQFVSFDEMKASTGPRSLGPEFIDLIPAVEAKLGPEYKLIQGHRCVTNDRRYVHLILTGKNGAIVSLVITEKNKESFSESDAVAVIKSSDIPIYRDRQGILEIAGFESDKYFAYVVSNLDRTANLNVASVMAPVVYNHLHKLEL
jgi:hypothetical protein